MPSYRWSPFTGLAGGSQLLHGTAALRDGRIVVLHTDQSGATSRLNLSFLDGTGVPLPGPPQTITSHTELDAPTARIVALAHGGFAVAYQVASNRILGETGIRLQIFYAEGAPAGPVRTITSASGEASLSDLKVLEDGALAVLWQTNNSGGRLYDPHDRHLIQTLLEPDGTTRLSRDVVESRDGTRTEPASPYYNAALVPLAEGGHGIRFAGDDGDATYMRFDAFGVFVGERHLPKAAAQGIAPREEGGSILMGEGEIRLLDADGKQVSETLPMHRDGVDWANSLPAIDRLPDGRILLLVGRQNSPGTSARDVLLVDQQGTHALSASDILRLPTKGRASWTDIDALPDGRYIVSLGRYQVESGKLAPQEIWFQIMDPRSGPVQLNGTVAGDHYGGTPQGDVIRGFLGDDLVWGHRGDDFILGEAGDDVLKGQTGNDIVSGGGGNDTLDGGQGDDRLNGGPGADLLLGGRGTDLLTGGPGNDLYGVDSTSDRVVERAKGGTDEIRSGDISLALAEYPNIENAGLWGDKALDVTGTARANLLTGNAGANTVTGQGGGDTMTGGDGSDTMFGGKGNDLIRGDGGEDSLFGGAGADTLDGGNGNDAVAGQGGHDLLRGGDGDDLVQGAKGNDTLDGGTGDDVLEGGPGADRFVYRTGFDADTVADFQPGTDVLALDPALWSGTLSPAEVLDTFGSVVAGDLVLAFGAGQSVTLLGVTEIDGDLAFL